MDIRTKEAVRYLGYGRSAVDEKTLQLVKDSFAELEEYASVKFTYRIFELSFADTDKLTIGNMTIRSKNLAKNLQGCRSAVVLGITLGTAVDLLLKRYSVVDMAKVVVLQACATTLLEEYCDEAQGQIAEELETSRQHFRPRFSPGYGDFSILHQEEILRMLDASKRIGLSMTDNSMLIPTKSVTAVIGISDTKESCHIRGCEACEKLDCSYRRS